MPSYDVMCHPKMALNTKWIKYIHFGAVILERVTYRKEVGYTWQDIF
jgi:hypothetical protein